MEHQVPRVLSLPRPPRDTLSPEMSSKQHPGDDGHSDLLRGARPPKSDPVFECLGWLDELNSALGQLRVTVRATPLDADLRAQQLVLGRIMGMVAGGKAAAEADPAATVTKSDVTTLEELERDLRAQTTIAARFCVPGDGTEASALADVARARCRTTERALVAFMRDRPHDLAPAQRFLNRLSDYLFVVARYMDGPE